MDLARPEFVPDPSLSREEMERLQREVADAAVFADDLPVDPAAVSVPEPLDPPDATPDAAGGTQTTLGAASATDDAAADRPRDDGSTGRPAGDAPLVAGVDQAFVGDRAVSVVVVLRDGAVVERVHAVEETEVPYVPGLLSFREGGAVLAACQRLDAEPDVAFVDGSGRVHFREAGLATHVGAALDLPTVGVAKSLLCGRPRESLDRKLPAGARVAVEADDDVTAPDGTTIGYAVQTRQFESDGRHVNPVYASPGHRTSAGTAADLVEQCAAGYKLPEPTRLADSYADEVTAAVRRGNAE